ncbi:hypothetical protein [Helicobacter sp. 23-1045]
MARNTKMHDILEKKASFRERATQTYKLYFPYFIALILLSLMLWHIFDLLIGDKSLMVLLTLWEQEDALQESVRFYKEQNAFLQKEIFELVGG